MLIFGKQSTNEVTPLLVDSLGRPIVSFSAAPETTYNSILQASGTVTMAAGTNNIDMTAVPASQAYILKNWLIFYTGTVAGVTIRISVRRSAVTYEFAYANGLTSAVRVFDTVDIPLIASDFIRFQITNATVNDTANAYAVYRRIQ